MLEKTFKDRIIRGVEAQKFEKLLAPHQNAITASDQTILGKALTEVGHGLSCCHVCGVEMCSSVLVLRL